MLLKWNLAYLLVPDHKPSPNHLVLANNVCPSTAFRVDFVAKMEKPRNSMKAIH
jgi:hypothetical protein